MNETVKKIKEIITNTVEGINVEDIMDEQLFSDAGIDSLESFEILLGVEEGFKISIPEDVVEDLDSIEKIKNHIESK